VKPNESKNIYTDEVDYANTPNSSVWGTEDQATTGLLQRTGITGQWLNLCAGDGRFNNQLLEKANTVIASDIDDAPLKKLARLTPDALKNKLVTKTFNVTDHFPFDDQAFDGIFCVGTLHLFPRPIFQGIVSEMGRVLKSGGRIIIDFATDIKRTYPDGSLWTVPNEPNYTLNEAIVFLNQIFKDYQVNMITSHVNPEKVKLNDKEYLFTSNFILIDAVKKLI
jgi:SAM-dependent methyltransferase